MTFLVILDTNILLFLANGQFNLNKEIGHLITKKHELSYLTCTLKELDYLKEKNKTLSKKVNFVQKLLRNIKEIPYDPITPKTTDEKLIQFAIENKENCVIVTGDILLKNRLREKDLPVICVRNKNHLDLIGVIY